MTLRVAGGPVRGRGRGIRGGLHDPVLAAGGIYLLSERTRFARPGLAFARAQQVFGLQADGSLAAYTGAQVPWEAQGVRLDPGWVQRALSTDAFATAAWTAADTAVADGAWVAQDGTPYAKVAASATTATHLLRQTITYTAGEVTTITFLLRAAEETVLVVRAGNGATVWGVANPVFATFDAATGVAATGTHGSSASMVRLHGDAWLCSVTTVASTAAGNAQAQLVLRQASAYLGNGSAGLFVGRFNITNTAYRVPLTIAVAASVTVPNFSFSGLLADMGVALGGEYTIGFEAEYITPLSTSSHIARLDDGTDSNRTIFFRAGSGTSVSGLVTTANSAVYTGAASSGGMTRIKQALRVKQNDMRAASGGALLTADDGASAMPLGINRVVVGHGANPGVNVLNGYIRNAWIVPTQGHTDAQLQALSTL